MCGAFVRSRGSLHAFTPFVNDSPLPLLMGTRGYHVISIPNQNQKRVKLLLCVCVVQRIWWISANAKIRCCCCILVYTPSSTVSPVNSCPPASGVHKSKQSATMVVVTHARHRVMLLLGGLTLPLSRRPRRLISRNSKLNFTN